ncbi:MAG: S-layer homology domain-containing protein [Oscillospiraceae bacterium]
MKAKKLLSVLLSLVMVLSLLPVTVLADSNVAQIGETTYTSLSAAVTAAAEAGMKTTITMLADVDYRGREENLQIPVGADIVLDMNSHTITSEYGWYAINNQGTLTIQNGTVFATSETYEDEGTFAYGIINNGGNLTLNKVTVNTNAVVDQDYGEGLWSRDGYWGWDEAVGDVWVSYGRTASLSIIDCTFNAQYLWVDHYAEGSSAVIYSGTFVMEPDLNEQFTLAEGREWDAATNQVIDATNLPKIARVGEQEYASLDWAIRKAVESGGTMVMLADVERVNARYSLDGEYGIGAPGSALTIDLNGHTLTLTRQNASPIFSVATYQHTNSSLTIRDTSANAEGTLVLAYEELSSSSSITPLIMVNPMGTFTLESGNIKAVGNGYSSVYPTAVIHSAGTSSSPNGPGTVTISGGSVTYEGLPNQTVFGVSDENITSNITVYAGTFSDNVSKYVAAGRTVIKAGSLYKVVPGTSDSSVVDCVAVAKVGSTYYGTLEAAMEAADLEELVYLIADVTLNADFAVPWGKWLYIQSGATLTIPEGKTLTNNYLLENCGTIVCDGSICNGSSIDGFAYTGCLINENTLSVIKGTGTITNDENCEIMNNGTISARIVNSGTIYNNGATGEITGSFGGNDPVSVYTLDFDLNGGTSDGQKFILQMTKYAGEKFELPVLEREGYVFTGWCIGDTKVSSPYTVTDNVEFTAQWSAVSGTGGSIVKVSGAGGEDWTVDTRYIADGLAEQAASNVEDLTAGVSKDAAVEELEKNGVTVNEETAVSIIAEPYLSVEVDDTATTDQTLTLDIKALYDVKATTADLNSESNSEMTDENTVTLSTGNLMEVTGDVTLSVPLPGGFAGDAETLYVEHTKEDGTVYIYTGTVETDSSTDTETAAGQTLTFVNPHGFSTFKISTTNSAAATVKDAGGNVVGYLTLQEAIDAVQNGGTIEVLQSGLSATVSGDKTFTVTGEAATLTAAEGYELTKNNDGTYTVSPSSGDLPGSGSGSGSGSNSGSGSGSSGDNGSGSGGSETTGLPFSDIGVNHTFYEYVKYVYENNIMNGKTATRFDAVSSLTRAQLVTILYRMAGSPSTYNNTTLPFSDRGEIANAEFVNAVKWAVAEKIVGGYDDGTFRPNAPMSRQALVAVLYRYANSLGFDTDASSNQLAGFQDGSQVSASMVDAMNWALENGMLSGSAGKLNPAGSTTRGAAAKILAGFHKSYIA